jgi:hypothetical protein
MSQDPYPSQRPDPRGTDPYVSDPYVRDDEPARPPAYEPGARPPAPMPSAPMGPGPFAPPPYGHLPPPAPVNVSAIVLVVFSGMAMASGYCCVAGIPALILGILGLTKNATDPEGAQRLTNIGWITFGALLLLTVLAVVGFFVVVVAAGSST